MKLIEIINIISCVLIFTTSMYMLFVHYGSKRSQLEKHLYKTEYLLVKLGLIFMAMGTAWSFVIIEEHHTSQVVLNLGLSFFMFWNSIRLNRMFVRKKRQEEKLNVSSMVDPKKQDFPDEQF